MKLLSNSIFHNRKYFLKIINSFCIIVITTTLLLSFILTYFFTSSTKNTIAELNYKILSQISYSTVYMNDLINNVVRVLYINNYVSAFRYNTASDIEIETNAVKSLQSIVSQSPFVDSIYVYNESLDAIVSSRTGGVYTQDSFYDKGAFDVIKNHSKYAENSMDPDSRTVPPAEVNAGIATGTPVFTYVVKEFAANDNSVMLININSSYLNGIISALNKSQDSLRNEIIVLDSKSRLLSHISNDNENRLNYNTSELSESFDSQSTLVKKINGVKYQITKVTSGLNWTYISLTPYDIITADARKLIVIAFLISAVVLLLGVAIVVFASKKIYSPIENLSVKVKLALSGGEHTNTFSNEVDMISNAFSNAISEIKQIDKLKGNNIYSIKNDFLKNYFNCTFIYKKDDLYNRFKYFGMDGFLNHDCTAFMVIIDKYNKLKTQMNEQDVSLLKYAISNIASELAGDSFNHEFVYIGENKFVGVVCLEEENNTQFYENLIKICSALQQAVSTHFDITLTCACTKKSVKTDLLPQLVSDLKTLSKYKIQLGNGQIITDKSINLYSKTDFKIPYKKEQLLIDSLILGNYKKSCDIFNDIVDGFLKYNYDTIFFAMTHISFTIYDTLSKKYNTVTSPLSTLSNDFFEKLISLETIEDFTEEFLELFSEITTKVNSTKSDAQNALVESIKEIVEKKYSDVALCLNSVAEELSLSTSYIGRIFKAATNKSISEYILDVRMNEVKRLLDTTDMDIDKITELTGFEKNNYFYTLFKKYFGISLTTYRMTRQ